VDRGKLAENFASEKLQSLGFKIISRNFHSRFGEIDIIATKDLRLYFIEVKARWNLSYGAPEEAVTWYKLKRIQKTAYYFSMTHPELPKEQRIVVFALEHLTGKPVSYRIIDVF
jgi:putative endonuclease